MSERIRWATVTPDGVLHLFADEPTLERITHEAQGTPTLVPMNSQPWMSAWINEHGNTPEGDPLEMNPRATAFLRLLLWPGQRVVGTVAFTGVLEGEDHDTPGSLSEEALAHLRDNFTEDGA